ncbi:MAG: BphX family protein [bacterium]|nr:BphX family protein [bacterium]
MAEYLKSNEVSGMTRLKWWMRIVGTLYIFLFVAAAVIRIPIRVLGPEGTLDRNAAGDVLAMFVVDTWVILGLALGAIGIGLLVASRAPEKAIALVWTVIGFELIWGLGSDMYQLARGYDLQEIGIWIIIHVIIITTGILALRNSPHK